MPWCLKNKQWYRRGGNMFPKKAFASPEKKSQNNRGVQTRRIPFKERRRRRSKKKKSGHKEQHEPFMFLAFHIVHRSPFTVIGPRSRSSSRPPGRRSFAAAVVADVDVVAYRSLAPGPCSCRRPCRPCSGLRAGKFPFRFR